jgi:iron complex outermembrane receptor protein
MVVSPFVSEADRNRREAGFGILANTLSFYEITTHSFDRDSGGLSVTKPVRQRNQGIEWNVFGEPIGRPRARRRLYMIGVITQSADGIPERTSFGIPRWQANFYGEWDLPIWSG